MSDALLVLNAGSSSLKFSVFLDDGPPQPLLRGQLEGLLDAAALRRARRGRPSSARRSGPPARALGHEAAIEFLLTWGRHGVLGGHRIVAVGHRVVHGGRSSPRPVLIDAATIGRARGAGAPGAAAPAAQPGGDRGRRAASRRDCRRWPASTRRSTAPSRRSRRRSPCRVATPTKASRRYGFHGLVLRIHRLSRCRGTDGRAAAGPYRGRAPRQRRQPVRHAQAARSVATTMSFTALDGLVMGTRCGAHRSRRPALPDRSARHRRDARWRNCSTSSPDCWASRACSSDMRTLLASADPRAAEAVDLFVYRIDPRARLARGGARRARCVGLHRRHRRERRGDPRARLSRRELARTGTRRGRQRARRSVHQPARQPRVRMGDPDERGIDDRHTYAQPAEQRHRCHDRGHDR